MPGRTNSAQLSFNPTQLPVYTLSLNPSPKFRTVQRYLNALHSMDYDKCMNAFDEDLEHRIIPQSLCRPVLNKKQYEEYFRGVMPRYKWIRFTLHEVIETEDKMTIHGTVQGESVKDTPYSSEYILLLRFSPLEEGATEQKICFVKEFVDSDMVTKFFAEDSAKCREEGDKNSSNGLIGSIGKLHQQGRESTNHAQVEVEGPQSPKRMKEYQGHFIFTRS